MKLAQLMLRPSAFVPVAMSVTALVLVLGYVSLFGVAGDADESPVAHLWQLLVLGQGPAVAFSLYRWLPLAPQTVLCVFGIQALALFAALAPVYLFACKPFC